jgi:two-component system sensor histidine kinase KdpD
MLGRSLTQLLLRRGAHLELTIIATPAERAQARRRLRIAGCVADRSEYIYATLATLVAFGLSFIADRYLSVANLSLIFLTAVLVVAVRTRMAVAVYTAILCFLGYNFFFAPPRYTLEIANFDDVLAVTLFLVAALVCSRLATRLASQVESLRASHAQTRALARAGSAAGHQHRRRRHSRGAGARRWRARCTAKRRSWRATPSRCCRWSPACPVDRVFTAQDSGRRRLVRSPWRAGRSFTPTP